MHVGAVDAAPMSRPSFVFSSQLLSLGLLGSGPKEWPFMDDFSLGLIWYPIFLLSTTLHEASHAYATMLGGDLTG